MAPEILSALIGAAATLAAALIAVIWGARRGMERGSTSASPVARLRTTRYDVFVSSPMAGLSSDEEIASYHERIAPVIALLEEKLGYSVYWAGRNIRRRADFEAADLSAIVDANAVIGSKYFLLIYPARIVTSALFEAGIALRNCQTSIYFVADRDDLPFLMAEASQAFTNVRIYEGTIEESLLPMLTKHRRAFFNPARAT